jgi:hypothetical protein
MEETNGKTAGQDAGFANLIREHPRKSVARFGLLLVTRRKPVAGRDTRIWLAGSIRRV